MFLVAAAAGAAASLFVSSAQHGSPKDAPLGTIQYLEYVVDFSSGDDDQAARLLPPGTTRGFGQDVLGVWPSGRLSVDR